MSAFDAEKFLGNGKSFTLFGVMGERIEASHWMSERLRTAMGIRINEAFRQPCLYTHDLWKYEPLLDGCSSFTNLKEEEVVLNAEETNQLVEYLNWQFDGHPGLVEILVDGFQFDGAKAVFTAGVSTVSLGSNELAQIEHSLLRARVMVAEPHRLREGIYINPNASVPFLKVMTEHNYPIKPHIQTWLTFILNDNVGIKMTVESLSFVQDKLNAHKNFQTVKMAQKFKAYQGCISCERQHDGPPQRTL